MVIHDLVHCLLSPATKYPKGVVTNFITTTSISKPQFSHRQCIFIRQVTTVFRPNIIILVAVTYFAFNHTTVGHSTFTLGAAGWSSSPIRHLRAISGHPPRPRTTILSKPEPSVITFIFYKLFTFLRTLDYCDNLLYAYVVLNLPDVGARFLKAIYLELNRKKTLR